MIKDTLTEEPRSFASLRGSETQQFTLVIFLSTVLYGAVSFYQPHSVSVAFLM